MIFKWLLMRDFLSYAPIISGEGLCAVIASLENSYSGGQWDLRALSESFHYGLMLGLDMQILDAFGKEIMNSQEAIKSLSGSMKNQITHFFYQNPLDGRYELQPLFSENRKIGTFKFRYFRKRERGQGESTKEGVPRFFRISLWIAGLGALILALLFGGYVPD